MKKPNRFSPEVRERAVRLVQEHHGGYPSLWAAVEPIAPTGRTGVVERRGRSTGSSDQRLRQSHRLTFLGRTLVVSDINGDFHVGQRELPDGYLIGIAAQ